MSENPETDLPDVDGVIAWSPTPGPVEAEVQLGLLPSKAALLLFMKSIAVELAPGGIRVNCVCPGRVGKMPSLDELDQTAAILPPGVDPMLFIRLNGVLPGVTEQHDIAEAIAYLASDAARSVSGTALLVDRVTLW
jgi:meso-butanediol dehydrogenase/(S,S)-butanediol dehydrogenase/diacetyl reductase